MPPSIKTQELKKAVSISLFASMAVVLGLVEALIPFAVALPGAKLGLGNIMILTCLYFFRGKDALLLIFLKTILTAFLLGTFSTFLFSLFGSISSFIAMLVLLRLGKDKFSFIGVSIAGGIMHNMGQLGAAAIVLGTTSIFYYLPFLLLTGLVTGIFTGMAAKYLIQAIERAQLFVSLIK